MSYVYWFLTNTLEPWTVLMFILGVLVFWPQKTGTPSRRWLRFWYALLYLYCTPLAAYTSTWLLERPYPKQVGRPEGIDAIVVLSGGVIFAEVDGDQVLLAENSLRRCERAAELYHAGGAVPILITGGIVYATDPGPPISESMAKFLELLGVPKSDIVLETKSRNTAENAKYSAEIIQERGWQRVAMVTSALHLGRADHLFRQQGIVTLPVGSEYRTQEFPWDLFAILPSETALNRHQEAFHEFLGCLFLMVQGKW